MLSDDQMNGLLRDFFRLEAPTELNQPFSVADLKSSRTAFLSESQSDSVSPLTSSVDAQPSRRFMVSSVLATLAMSLFVFLATKDSGSTSLPTAAITPEQKSPENADSALMNVSGQGDAKGSNVPVGNDGVTLEETEKIELKPRP